MEPVEGGQVPECLRGGAGVGIDVGEPGEEPRRRLGQVGVHDQRVPGDQVQDRRKIGGQDGEHDARQGDDIGGTGQPPPCRPTQLPDHLLRFLPSSAAVERRSHSARQSLGSV